MVLCSLVSFLSSCVFSPLCLRLSTPCDSNIQQLVHSTGRSPLRTLRLSSCMFSLFHACSRLSFCIQPIGSARQHGLSAPSSLVTIPVNGYMQNVLLFINRPVSFSAPKAFSTCRNFLVWFIVCVI